MDVLNASCDLDEFFARLGRSSYPLLMLDYDGTLAPFRPERDEAIPYAGVRERLSRLVASVRTRTVIVSGRAVADIIPLLGLPVLPEIWGSHGAERRFPDGTLKTIDLPPVTRLGLAQFEAWAREQGLGRYLEQKPGALAFHWRKVAEDEAANLRRTVTAHWAGAPETFGLTLREFDGGLELKPVHTTKAIAIHSLLHEAPEDTVAAFLGDDLTDEDAFEAMAGHGLAVLVRRESRPTGADIRISPPEELLAFLDRWLSVAE